MYKRNQSEIVNKALNHFPAVVITGVRQCGKTSLAKSLRPGWKYLDFEKSSVRDLVLNDPELFFKNNTSELILDEAQLYPEIFNTLRGVIDANRSKPNRFIVTGSSSPDLLAQAADTLAGRVGLIELPPLKMNEVYDRSLPNFYDIFNAKLNSKTLSFLKNLSNPLSNQQVRNSWLHGGFPEPLAKNDYEFYRLWYENYIATFLTRDLKAYFSGIDTESYRLFLGILRDYHAQEMNIAELARSLGIGETSVRRYLEIAHKTFFWRKLASFQRTALRSTVKTPRGLYRDSGIYHHLLGIHSLEDLDQSRYKGASFEAFVIEEIIRGLSCTKASFVETYFYRTRGGAEIDLILKGSFGLLPIEIKHNSNVTRQDVSSLCKFIEEEDLPVGIVVCFCDTVEFLNERVLRVPVGLI